MQGCSIYRECRRMEPVGKWQSSKINIVVRGSRSSHNHSTPETITILNGVMRVVPLRRCQVSQPQEIATSRTYCGAILRGFEAVPSRFARCNGAFSDSIDTIHLIRTQLPHTVPVNACPVVGKTTCDCDFECVAPVRNECLSQSVCVSKFDRHTYRARKLTIDDQHLSFKPIWCHGHVGEL
jgi:hypothetical protein